MTTINFDGVDLSTIPEVELLRVRRPIVGNRRDDYIEVPGREGFWLFTERPGARTIVLEFDILATSFADRRAAVVELADYLDSPRGLARLIVDDEPDRFHLCRLSSAPDPEEWLNHGAFSVELTAEPFAQALTPSVETWSAATGVAEVFSIPDKVDAFPEFEITANGGTITGFSLDVNGTVLTYAVGGTGLIAGETLTVSTIGYVVTRGVSGDPDLDGSFDPDDLDMETVSGDFGDLLPGSNSVTITRTGTATTIGVVARWRRRSR